MFILYPAVDRIKQLRSTWRFRRRLDRLDRLAGLTVEKQVLKLLCSSVHRFALLALLFKNYLSNTNTNLLKCASMELIQCRRIVFVSHRQNVLRPYDSGCLKYAVFCGLLVPAGDGFSALMVSVWRCSWCVTTVKAETDDGRGSKFLILAQPDPTQYRMDSTQPRIS